MASLRNFFTKDLERFSSTGLDDAKKIVDRCIECNYSILCIDDELFPKCLYNIECPPALIYVNGVMPDIDNIFQSVLSVLAEQLSME